MKTRKTEQAQQFFECLKARIDNVEAGTEPDNGEVWQLLLAAGGDCPWAYYSGILNAAIAIDINALRLAEISPMPKKP